MDIEQTYRETAPKLQQYLISHGCSYANACDIVQETFLKLWQKRDELRDDPHQVNGLIYTIARNLRNGLARKSKREVLAFQNPEGEIPDVEDEAMTDDPGEGPRSRSCCPIEDEEGNAVIRHRLKASLDQMPVELLEAFALSRLSRMTVKDIARGTDASEANVKVRVHRAKAMMAKMMNASAAVQSPDENPGKSEHSNCALVKAMMMLAAVDGEIAKEELALYRELAERMRKSGSDAFGAPWKESVKSMAYIGFLSEMLDPQDLIQELVRSIGAELGPDDIAALKQMAEADGDFSQIERDCIAALEKSRVPRGTRTNLRTG